jgi:MFS transporter, CP family, cyanate transporter
VAGLLAAFAQQPAEQPPIHDAAIPKRRPSLDYGLLWRLGLIFGSNNSVYFGTNAFLPLYLVEVGRPELIPTALAIYNFAQLPSSLLVMAFAGRIEGRIWPYFLAGTLLLSSIAVICMTADAWTLIATATLGFASGISLVLGLALPPLLSEPSEVGRVSAGMFMISYAFAMIVSVMCGFASDLTGDTRSALMLIALSILPLLLLPPTIQFNRSPHCAARRPS